MTVKELMAELSKCDPDGEVGVKGCDCPYIHDTSKVLRNYVVPEEPISQAGDVWEIVIFPNA